MVFPLASVQKIKSQNMPNRRNRIPRSNLFALGISSTEVRRGDFENPGLAKGEPCDHLRLEAEAVALERKLLEHLPTERLGARFHVRDVEIAANVGEERHALVGLGVPEFSNFSRRSNETRSENRVGFAL